MEMGMREFRPNLSPYPHALLLLSLATDVISLISLPCTLEGSGGGGRGEGRRSPAQASQHLRTWPATLPMGAWGRMGARTQRRGQGQKKGSPWMWRENGE